MNVTKDLSNNEMALISVKSYSKVISNSSLSILINF